MVAARTCKLRGTIGNGPDVSQDGLTFILSRRLMLLPRKLIHLIAKAILHHNQLVFLNALCYLYVVIVLAHCRSREKRHFN